MSRRALLGVGILALWVGVMGWHVRREHFQPELARLSEATRSLDPTTHFYAVRMGERLVGLASSRLDTIPGGFVLEDRLSLELRAMAAEGSASATTTVRLTPTLSMSAFEFGLSSDAAGFRASGEVDGDSLLRVRVEAGGGPEDLTFRVTEPPISAAALPIRIAMAGGLREGRVFRFGVFDPSTVSMRTVEVEVLERDTLIVPDSAVRDPDSGRWEGDGHRTFTAWRLEERYGGIAVESWVDEEGRVLRSSSAMGLSLERAPFELIDQERAAARASFTDDPATDVVFSTAIAADPGALPPAGADDREELRFVLGGVDLEGFQLDGGRQELRGDTLVVRREGKDALDPGYALPYPRMDLAEALQPEPLIQSRHPRIEEAARRAARGAGSRGADPVEAARRLNEVVYESLRKEITFSLPSALQVLDTLAGDCNEHTVLFVAMARALGIPARPVVGLVHLDGAFYYHAWAEVWLGEWVAFDPTLGQAPAGAAHLRFITGGLAQQVEIARLIGNLSIRVVGS